jgi:hypothetical protein
MIRQAFSRGFSALPQAGPMLRVAGVYGALAIATRLLTPPPGAPVLVGLTFVLASLVLLPVNAMCAIGMLSVGVGVIRGTPDAERLVWRCLTKLPQFIVIGMVGFIALTIAAVPLVLAVRLLGAPGAVVACLGGLGLIYVLLVCSQFSFLIVDERAEWFEAMVESAAITRGHRFTLAAFLLCGAVPLGFVGSLPRLAARVHLVGESWTLPLAIGATIIGTGLAVVWTLVTAAFYDDLLARQRAQVDDALPDPA